MFKQAILVLSILFVSCDNQKGPQIQWGCDPPCKPARWLTFSYDKALLFHDTTGKLLSALAHKKLEEFVKQNHGTEISERVITSIDESLSCKMWTCVHDTVKRNRFAPTDVIAFLNAGKIVGFVVPCFKSNLVFCFPDSNNKDADLFDAIISLTLAEKN